MRFKSVRKELQDTLNAEKAKGWHPWFAWLPVQLTDGSDEVVWMESVERRAHQRSGINEFGDLLLWYEYREVNAIGFEPQSTWGNWTRGTVDSKEERT